MTVCQVTKVLTAALKLRCKYSMLLHEDQWKEHFFCYRINVSPTEVTTSNYVGAVIGGIQEYGVRRTDIIDHSPFFSCFLKIFSYFIFLFFPFYLLHAIRKQDYSKSAA
jgi:hypothetical protein